MEVHAIPPDGNCLFRDVIHQLGMVIPQNPAYTHRELRSETVQFIQNHLNDYIPTLLDSCHIYDSSQLPVQSNDQLLNRYLSDLQMDGFWGGAECLSAITRLKHIKIIVHHTGSQRQTTFVPDSGKYMSVINLLYNGVHYDSLTYPSSPLSTTISSTQDSHVVSITNNVHRVLCTSNNPYTVIDVTPTTPINPPMTISSHCFGTWNVRGINNSQKRDILDDVLRSNNIEVCSIQETNMGSGTCSTSNYTWYLTRDRTTSRRGVGILLRKDSPIISKRIRHYFGAIITLLGKIPNLGEILFISVYVPPHTSAYNRKQSSKIFTTLSSIIDRCPKSRDIVLLGDFNAHIGKNDSWNETYIGSNLFHQSSNPNGFSLGLFVNLAQLLVQTTKGRRIITTWTDGKNYSQVDHILTREKNKYIYVNSIKADTYRPSISDHRLIWINCSQKQRAPITNYSASDKSQRSVTPSTYNLRSLNLSLLQDITVESQYQATLAEIHNKKLSESTHNSLWKTILDSVTICRYFSIVPIQIIIKP